MVKSSREDFLSRWSSLKQKARETELDTTAEADEARFSDQPVGDDQGASEAAALSIEPEKSDEDILQELGLPSPESLMKGDSIAGFLKAGVPMRLRNRALRRLWLTDPVFANLDGLNDYDGDYTDAATVVKGLRSAYRPGKGYFRDDPAPKIGDADTTDEMVTEAEETAAPGEATLAEAEGAAGEDLAGSGSPEDGAASPEHANRADLSEEDSPEAGGSETESGPEIAEPEEAGDEEEAGDKNASMDDEPAAANQRVSEPVIHPRRMQFHFDAG